MRLALPLAALAAIFACSDSTGPRGSPSVQLVRGASVSDTVGATLPVALVVEVHDSSGALAPVGTVVQFTSVTGNPDRPAYIAVQSPGSTSSGSSASTIVDEAGQATVLITLGGPPGVGHVAVTVPSLGLLEYAAYTVLPGKPARTVIAARDTVLYVGDSFDVRASVVDRSGFKLPGQASLVSSGSGLTITAVGVVTATALGHYVVKGKGAPATDSIDVRVMPRLRLAGVTGTTGINTIAALEADGSGYITLADASYAGYPAWIPGTSTVVFHQDNNNQQLLFVADATGVKRFLVSPPPELSQALTQPAPSADGKWVFFSGCFEHCVARAAADGTNAEVLLSGAWNPSPSPDGSKVAYKDRADFGLRVFDIATRTSSSMGTDGTWPAWSPTGGEIAYVTFVRDLGFLAPDGTPTRTFSFDFFVYVINGWTPDGKWVIAQTSIGPLLVDATTGSTIPLAYPKDVIVTSAK